MNKKLVVLTLFVAIFAFSCKKSEEFKPKTKLELLTGSSSKSWKNSAAIAKNGGIELNLLATQPVCLTDNLLILSNNNTFEIREGATKCASNDPDLVIKANWQLSADETTISLDKFLILGFTLNNVNIKITELTETSIKGETTIVFNGQNYQLFATFVPAQ